MTDQHNNICPQSQRALRLLISPDAPRVDRAKLINALPGKTPTALPDLLELIIQIILALLENLDKDKDDDPEPIPDPYLRLHRLTYEVAQRTIPKAELLDDLPKLITAITTVAAMIPNPGFPTHRLAREQLRSATNAALRPNAQRWITWNNTIRTELETLEAANYLTDLNEYKLAWTTLANALETLLDSAQTTTT